MMGTPGDAPRHLGDPPHPSLGVLEEGETPPTPLGGCRGETRHLSPC